MEYIMNDDRTVTLKHHGVLGMKWGVRRYRNANGSLNALGQKRYGKVQQQYAKARSAKTNFMKRYHTINANQMKGELQRAENVTKAKTLKEKFSQAYGYGALKTSAKAAQKGYSESAKYNKNSWMGNRRKTAYESAAYNNEQLANYADKMKKSSKGTKAFENLVYAKNYMNMSMKTVAGRKTTVGKQYVDYLLTGGIGSMVQDAKYRSEQKKKKSS